MNGAWLTEQIQGKTADLFEPSNRPRFGLIHLHPYGLETPRGKSLYSRLLEELRLACICPHGQHSWWADRRCQEFDTDRTAEHYLLDTVVPFFAERWNLHPRGIGLHGISMGGQGALRLGFKYPNLFPVVAAVSAAVEYHELYGQGLALDEMYESKEQCRQDTVPMHINPSQFPPRILFCIDPDDEYWFRGCDRLAEKLRALGIPFESDLTTRAGGHSWQYFDNMADRTLRFVAAGLEHESRRLL